MARIPPRDNSTLTRTPGTTTPDAVTTPATDATPATDPTPAGLDASTAGGTIPTGDNTPSGAPSVAGAMNALGARAGLSMRDDLYKLDYHNAPNAIGLDDVLKNAGPAAAKAVVQQLVTTVEQQMGIKLDPTLVSAAMAKPERIANLLMFTPQQMSDGIDALNLAHQQGHIQNVPPKKRALGDKIDLAKLDLSKIDRPQASMKALAPGLLQGGAISSLDDTSAKRHLAMAEVFDQLAENALRAPKDRVEVKFMGRKLTRLDNLVGALRDEGYKIDVSYRRRVANFAELVTQDPATGALKEVPAPLMVRTGYTDAQGKEAVVPSVHSEMVIGIESPDGKPDLDASLKWYQGISGTGFFAEGLMATPPWLGNEITTELKGDKAEKAIELAGLQSAVINDVASKGNMLAAGYGVLGVCNDTVAWNEQMVTGKTDVYPLLHRDGLLEPALLDLLKDTNRRDDPEVRTLLEGIRALPSDHTVNSSQKSRAGASIPWPKGKEPLVSSQHAQRTLTS